MLPSEMECEIPKSVLRYIWSIKILKAGLGVHSENEVREWFFRNSHILVEFEKLNSKIAEGIKELQQTAIQGLKYETGYQKPEFDSLKRKRLE